MRSCKENQGKDFRSEQALSFSKMYLCFCCIVVTIGVILFFSDYGSFIIQLGWQKLCFLTPRHVITKILHEISTQTDQTQEETPSQDKDEYFRCGDEIDAANIKQELACEVGLQCPNVKQSLRQVFECAYSQFILTWYSVPEPRENQPLYNALGKEFDMFVDRVIKRASDISIPAIAVNSLRILTQHLRNAKQAERVQLFSTRAEEITVLRVFSESLVRNLFPESLTAQDLTRSALNEIVTLKVLELLVNWLSDPDSLNQLVVSHLDAMTPESSTDELQEMIREDTPSSLDSEGKGVIAEGTDKLTNDGKPKKKGTKLKRRFTKFVDKMKIKETKKKRERRNEPEPVSRSFEHETLQYNLAMNDEFMACSASCAQDSNSDDSDMETRPLAVQEEMIEFKLSYEMWRLSCWVVSVKEVEEDDGELSFTISLAEASNPEKLRWDVSKSRKEIRLFYSSLQGCANLPSIAELLESTENTMSDEFKEQARATLETFLQELIKDNQLGQSPEVFQFLCPLEQLLTEEEANGGVWSLLSNLAYILTPAKWEEEDVGPVKSDDPGTEGAEPEGLAEIADEEADPKGSCDSLCQFTTSSGGSLPLDSGDRRKSLKEALDFQAAFLPVTDLSEERTVVRESNPKQDDGAQQNGSTDDRCFTFKAGAYKKDKIYPKSSARLHKRRENGQLNVGTAEEHTAQEPNKRDVNQAFKEPQEATKAIIDLLKEITGSAILCDVILKCAMPLLKRKVNSYLNKMSPTEPQIASYIDNMREKQWPGGVPVVSRPVRTKEQKSETKQRAHQLIETRCPSAFFLKKNVLAVFKIFQDTEENKKLLYRLLFLLKELMPGESTLNDKAPAFLNSPV